MEGRELASASTPSCQSKRASWRRGFSKGYDGRGRTELGREEPPPPAALETLDLRTLRLICCKQVDLCPPLPIQKPHTSLRPYLGNSLFPKMHSSPLPTPGEEPGSSFSSRPLYSPQHRGVAFCPSRSSPFRESSPL